MTAGVSGLGHPRLAGLILAVGAAVGLYLVLPALAGLDETWRLLGRGDARWLGLALALELGSYAGYVVLFNGVFASRAHAIGLRRSYEITLAGVAATRLFAAAGAGGVVLTAWALRRSGMSRAAVVSGMTTFLVVLYAVYMTALVVAGLGLHVGLLPGPAPFALTFVPAVFGATVIAAALAAGRVPADLAQRAARHSPGRGHAVQLAARGTAAMARGVRGAIALVRARDPALLGALAWWGFDVAVLWSCFRAFGSAPPVAVVVLVYFVGMLANTLPLPGGIGGVDGGMIGAAIGFGVDGGLAIVAVLAYRGIAFWLPTVPGAIAYLRLRRSLDREPPTSGGVRAGWDDDEPSGHDPHSESPSSRATATVTRTSTTAEAAAPTRPTAASPIRTRSPAIPRMNQSSGSSSTALSAWVRNRIEISGAPGISTISAATPMTDPKLR